MYVDEVLRLLDIVSRYERDFEGICSREESNAMTVNRSESGRKKYMESRRKFYGGNAKTSKGCG